ISSATFVAASPAMSATVTDAPSEASTRAVARPMPEPAPVTMATFSANLIAGVWHLLRERRPGDLAAFHRALEVRVRALLAQLAGGIGGGAERDPRERAAD